MISNLRRLRQYLDRYPRNVQPGAFEFLVTSAFARGFHLPFKTRTTDDSAIVHKVVWYGEADSRKKTFTPAPSGPDGACFCCGYNLLIESTLRGDVSNQWRKEFVESLNHYDGFVIQHAALRNDLYLAFVAPEFHRSTYTGFKQKASEGYNIIMLECQNLSTICDICSYVQTLRHLDLRYLLRGIVKKLRESGSLTSFRKDVRRYINDWEVELLKQERTVYFGLKSYEAMKKVGSNIVGVSDIMLKLQRDPRFERCIRKLGGSDLTQDIREGLLKERLARIVEAPNEDLFCRVEGADFKARGLRLIRAVESLDQ